MRLSRKKVKQILNKYRLPIPKTRKKKMNEKKARALVEKTLAEKYCSCIKMVSSPKNKRKIPEKGAIAICRKSVFDQKDIGFYRFTCKKRASLLPRKNKTQKVYQKKKQ